MRWAPLRILPFIACVQACSNFYMNYTNPQFRISARSMDYGDEIKWIMHSFPRGRHFSLPGAASWTSSYGYVGFTPGSFEVMGRYLDVDRVQLGSFSARDGVFEGLNEKGLSCAILSLVGAEFQQRSPIPSQNIMSVMFCKWVLENFEDVDGVMAALEGKHFFVNVALHFAVQDRHMRTIVVEHIGGERKVHLDLNDGVTGFGIMTNSPRFEWQLMNVQHLEWKRSMARSSVSVPGNWYPDERFIRIHLVKSALETTRQPQTYREAVAYCVAALNTVTVPMGSIPGTDSGASSGEGGADHTQWAVIRDHRSLRLYLRSSTNPSLRLIDLGQLKFDAGLPISTMQIEEDPWFLDVSGGFTPSLEVSV